MRKVSRMLDHLLVRSGYNSELRPGVRGVTVVSVNIAVTTLGPVEDEHQTLVLTCYLRHSWRDSRLSFSHFISLNMSTLSLNWIFLDSIWKPDTYVLGGRESFLHRITSPNRLVRLAQDGTISYSQRLTIATNCRMNLRKFPMDVQQCSLELSSFGFTRDELMYEWSGDAPVSIDQLAINDYTFTGLETGVRNMSSKLGHHSVLSVQFRLSRTLGFYFLRTYFPLMIIVTSSWVSFWLVRTPAGGEIVARVGLGITCCLGEHFIKINQ